MQRVTTSARLQVKTTTLNLGPFTTGKLLKANDLAARGGLGFGVMTDIPIRARRDDATLVGVMASSTGPHILVVTPRSPRHIGGVERHVRETTSRLAAAGIPIRVLCAETGIAAIQDDEVEGVRIRSVPGYPTGTDWMLAPGLWSQMAASPADVIHVQSYHTFVAPLAMARARSLNVPFLLTFHGGGSSHGWRNRVRGAQRRAQRGLYASASKLVAVAEFEVELYSQELRLDPARFSIIPNGTDIAVGAADADQPSPPIDRDAPVTIASIGRLEAYKGHHRAIAAMAGILRRRPNARLMIVGQGRYEAELRAIAAASGHGDRIAFTSVAAGDGGGMAQLLRKVDLVLLMSEFETHPLVALEAAALRRRLVVADVSGLAELAAKGFGQPVALELPPDLVATVVDRELSRPGPAAAPEPYTWDDCTAALLQLYGEITTRL
jgi:glycosyltransferase involved in cell wall biosynthesis